MRSKNVRWSWPCLYRGFTLLTALLLFLKHSSAQPNFPANPALERALLEADWKTVARVLEADDSKATSPVARLLMAHACLFDNQNNAATDLILSASGENDLNQWLEWTDTFQKAHSRNHVALFLHADSLARKHLLQESVAAFGS